MNLQSRSRWQLRGAALLIFLLGVTTGALVLNLYHKRQAAQLERRVWFAQALEQLQLTPEQKPQVEQILRDARGQLRELRRETQPKFSAVRAQTDERLKTVLTPPQWARFQELFRNESQRRRNRAPWPQ